MGIQQTPVLTCSMSGTVRGCQYIELATFMVDFDSDRECRLYPLILMLLVVNLASTK